MIHTLVLGAGGTGIGSHAYVIAPASYGASEFPCTAAQAASPTAWKLVDGALVEAPKTLQQQALAAKNAGLRVVSTATPDLSTTYPADDRASAEASGLLAFIAAGLTLPGGVISWADVHGMPHTFTASQFKTLAQVIFEFRLALSPLIAGAPGTLPAQPVAIP